MKIILKTTIYFWILAMAILCWPSYALDLTLSTGMVIPSNAEVESDGVVKIDCTVSHAYKVDLGLGLEKGARTVADQAMYDYNLYSLTVQKRIEFRPDFYGIIGAGIYYPDLTLHEGTSLEAIHWYISRELARGSFKCKKLYPDGTVDLDPNLGVYAGVYGNLSDHWSIGIGYRYLNLEEHISAWGKHNLAKMDHKMDYSGGTLNISYAF